MELRQLEYFVAVVETGSFSFAAERCSVAQPSLSQQVIKLEHEIGHQLFDRLGRKIILTEVGKVLYPRARAILSEVQQAHFAVTDGYFPEEARIAVGIIPTLGPYLMGDTVAQFKSQHPAARLVILEDTTDVLVEKLMNAELDVCYLSLPLNRQQITAEELFVEPLYIAVESGHALAALSAIPTEALKSMPFIQLTDKNCLSSQLDAFCHYQHINPPVVYQTTQLATALEFVRLGMGLSLVPACTAAAYPDKDVKFIPILENPPSRVIVAARHRGHSASPLECSFSYSFIQAWSKRVGQPLKSAKGEAL